MSTGNEIDYSIAKGEIDLYEEPPFLSGHGSVGFDDKATTRLLRKIDLHLIPFLALLYLLSFLDRSNIGNAKLVDLENTLHMVGLDYNVSSRLANQNGHITDIKERLGHIFSLLCGRRNPLKPHDQGYKTVSMDTYNHGSLGNHVCRHGPR